MIQNQPSNCEVLVEGQWWRVVTEEWSSDRFCSLGWSLVRNGDAIKTVYPEQVSAICHTGRHGKLVDAISRVNGRLQ